MKLAEIAGVSTSLIASIETRKKFPSSVSINKLAQAFGIEPYQLFLEENSETDKSTRLGLLKEELKSGITEQIESSFRSFFQGK
ncbi:MAG: helix-turn-helix transcriptional regulator [Bacteroidetes bacterium]|nr:helix-turn-helix transcriptional regulator [Bacteroidota bacterium]